MSHVHPIRETLMLLAVWVLIVAMKRLLIQRPATLSYRRDKQG